MAAIVFKAGRDGGTFAHRHFAFDFAPWISVEFKLYVIKECQSLRMKSRSSLGGKDVKDMSAVQRVAIEHLRGRTLPEEERLTIRPARVLREAPTGDERAQAFQKYQQHLDVLADRVRGIPEAEIEAVMNEASLAVRHSPE